jgi:hypothetical protein
LITPCPTLPLEGGGGQAASILETSISRVGLREKMRSANLRTTHFFLSSVLCPLSSEVVGTSGIEPPTTTMSRWCSTTELRAYFRRDKLPQYKGFATAIPADVQRELLVSQLYLRLLQNSKNINAYNKFLANSSIFFRQSVFENNL